MSGNGALILLIPWPRPEPIVLSLLTTLFVTAIAVCDTIHGRAGDRAQPLP